LSVGAVWNYAVTSIITWRQVRELGVAASPQAKELFSSKSRA